MYFNQMVEVLQGAVLRPLHVQRRRHRLGEGAVQRGALRPNTCGSNVCSTSGPDPRRDQPWVADQMADGKTPAQIKAVPGHVRRLGSLRLRRRRQLRRAGRLHRPLPDRPRGRGRGDGRRRQGTRDLEPPLVPSYQGIGVWGRAGPQGGMQFGGGHVREPRRPERHGRLGRRLHHAAGERRPRRLRARVRPRPRPARSVRHGRRRELDRLLDAHVRPARTSATARRTSARTPATSTPGTSSSSAG